MTVTEHTETLTEADKGGRLTNNDRYALWQAGDHHPDLCDCAGDDWSADGEWCSGLEDTFAAVESILSAHVARAVDAERDRVLGEFVESDAVQYALTVAEAGQLPWQWRLIPHGGWWDYSPRGEDHAGWWGIDGEWLFVKVSFGFNLPLFESPWSRVTPPASTCDGSFICDAEKHVHGCFADATGEACDDPSDHPVTPPGSGNAEQGGEG